MHGAILICAPQLIALSGVLTTTSGSSPVTSATRTVSGGGVLRFDTVTSGGGTPAYQLNGGAWTSITEGLTLSVAPSDTLAVRAALATPALTATFFLRNNANGALIESVTLTKS
jgi:hypothetical protein